MAAAAEDTMSSFYRTTGGAEIDLVLELPAKNGLWAIEVKRIFGCPVAGPVLAASGLRPTDKVNPFIGIGLVLIVRSCDRLYCKGCCRLFTCLD